MKTSRSSHPLVLAAALALAGACPHALAQQWSRAYRDRARSTIPSAICATAGGGFAIAAHSDAKYPKLLALDAAGNMTWMYVYDGLADDRAQFFGIAETAQRDLVAVGHHDFRPYFAVVDGRLGRIRQSFETTDRRGALLSVVPDATGGFVASGWIANAAGDADLLLVGADAAGRRTWQWQIGRPGGDEFGDRVVPLGVGYLVVGRTAAVGAGSTDLVLTYVSGTGYVGWQRAIGTSGLDASFGAPVATRAADGSIFVVAGRDYHGDTRDDVWLLKLGATGTVLWELAIDHAIDTPRSLRATPDGGCMILAETRESGSDDRDAWLLAVDATGVIRWQRRYGSALADDAVDLEPIADGGCAIVGCSHAFGVAETPGKWVWAVRVDAAGRVGQHCWIESEVAARSAVVRSTITAPSTPAAVAVSGDFRAHFVFDVLVPTIEAAQCATNTGPWTDLGHGTFELAGAGTLWPGDPAHLIVNGAPAGAAGALLIGTSTVYFDLLGVTIVPLPAWSIAEPAILANRSAVYALDWPLGFPAGFELFLQFAALDAAGPAGLAVSNGVRARTQ